MLEAFLSQCMKSIIGLNIVLKWVPFPQKCIPVSVLKSKHFCWSCRYIKNKYSQMLNDIFGRWVNLKPSCSIDLVFTIKQMGVVKTSQECCPVTLNLRVTMNVMIVVLNCQKCDQCLKGHKSLGLLF